MDVNIKPIIKKRYCFVYEGQYFEMNVYDNISKSLAILEIELTDERKKGKLPELISVIKEVTGDFRYKNHFLAKTQMIYNYKE